MKGPALVSVGCLAHPGSACAVARGAAGIIGISHTFREDGEEGEEGAIQRVAEEQGRPPRPAAMKTGSRASTAALGTGAGHQGLVLC